MVAFAPFAFVGIPLTKPWDGLQVAAFLTALVLVWSALAVTAVVLALRHANGTRGLARYAWCAAAAVLVLAAPIAVAMLTEQEDAHEDAVICIPGPIPKEIGDPIVGWIPRGYVWTPAVTGLAGLGFLVPATTRRQGAWILAATVMWVSLALGGAIMNINQCD
jgi:hypothetical protein